MTKLTRNIIIGSSSVVAVAGTATGVAVGVTQNKKSKDSSANTLNSKESNSVAIDKYASEIDASRKLAEEWEAKSQKAIEAAQADLDRTMGLEKVYSQDSTTDREHLYQIWRQDISKDKDQVNVEVLSSEGMNVDYVTVRLDIQRAQIEARPYVEMYSFSKELSNLYAKLNFCQSLSDVKALEKDFYYVVKNIDKNL